MNVKKVKVLKFGGSCLKSPEDISKIATILREENKNFPVIIISALYGITDLLIQLFEDIKKQNTIPSQKISEIYEYHLMIIKSLNMKQEEEYHTIKEVNKLNKHLEDEIKSLLETQLFNESARASIICFGERYSAIILSYYLNAQKLPAKVYFSEDCELVTQGVSCQAEICMKTFNAKFPLIKKKLLGENKIPVITGFYGTTKEKKITTFGRNGSDYTAAIIASGFNAAILEFWKDTNGLLTADPNMIQNPCPLEVLSFEEAEELMYYGTKILHNKTIEPLRKLSIEIRIKSFSNLSHPGTKIIRSKTNENFSKSITYNEHITIIRIFNQSNSYKPKSLFSKLNNVQIKRTDIISTTIALNNATLVVSESNLTELIEKINNAFPENDYRVEVKKDLALVALVGMDLIESGPLFEQILKTFSNEGIKLEFFVNKLSDLTSVFIVKKEMTKPAINAIHCNFF